MLGNNGPVVSAVGYRAMVLEGFHGAADEAETVDAVRHALDIGVNFLDTADAYGNGHNETLIGKAVRDRRDRAFVATKFGIVFDEEEQGTELPTGWGFSLRINGRPEYVRRSLHRSPPATLRQHRQRDPQLGGDPGIRRGGEAGIGGGKLRGVTEQLAVARASVSRPSTIARTEHRTARGDRS